jgi:hypothetical protein
MLKLAISIHDFGMDMTTLLLRNKKFFQPTDGMNSNSISPVAASLQFPSNPKKVKRFANWFNKYRWKMKLSNNTFTWSVTKAGLFI